MRISTSQIYTLASNRPEDLAFASPIRAQADSTNLGSANVSGVEVSNTTVGDSAFDGAGGLISSAPAQIYFTSEDTYRVLNASGTTLATVTGTTNLDSPRTNNYRRHLVCSSDQKFQV